MTLEKIEWITDGYDLHLIPGAHFDSLLKVWESDTSWRWASVIAADVNSQINVEFKPLINLGASGNVHKFGITIDTGTGLFEVDSTLPASPNRLYNFIIEATVTDETTNKSISSAIRIHIHDEILAAWLTPSHLSIHLGADGLRFSVLADFLDRVAGQTYHQIGDITRFPGFFWTSSDELSIIFKNEEDKKIGALSTVTEGDTTITATLPPLFSSFLDPITAEVGVISSWSDMPANLKLVDRPLTEITQQEIDKYPNVLFVSDGFQSEALFDKCTSMLVQNIKRNRGRLFTPLNLLAKRNRINFWSTFVSSEETLSSALAPLYYSHQARDDIALPYMPYAIKPDPDKDTDNSIPWTINELMFVVGRPTLADYDTVDFDVNYDDKKKEWETLFVDASKIKLEFKAPKPLWVEWKELGAYMLADETDTTLGISAGTRPNINRDAIMPPHATSWNPLRITRAHVNKFLENLRAPGETGTITRWTDGKDSTLVVGLSAESVGGGGAGGDLISMSFYWKAWTFVRGEAPALKLLTCIPQGGTIINPDLTAPVKTLLHEVCHNLDLDDEYGEFDSMDDAVEQDLEDEISMNNNVQAHSSLLRAHPGGLTCDNIKWSWPRIAKAGVLKKSPEPETVSTPDGNVHGFKVTLNRDYRPKNSKNYFRKGNSVCLRGRELEGSAPSKQFKVFKVDYNHVADEGDTVDIVDTIDPSFPFDPDGYPEDSLLLSLVPDLTPEPGDPEFRQIMHKAVVKHMDNTHAPLTVPRNDLTRDCFAHARNAKLGGGERQKPTNIPSLRHPKGKNLHTIIGLYEGGHRYHCKVYHPSGDCNMRSNDSLISRYCHVCRYILVDKLDPSLHTEIDREYAWDYPNR